MRRRWLARDMGAVGGNAGPKMGKVDGIQIAPCAPGLFESFPMRRVCGQPSVEVGFFLRRAVFVIEQDDPFGGLFA